MNVMENTELARRFATRTTAHLADTGAGVLSSGLGGEVEV